MTIVSGSPATSHEPPVTGCTLCLQPGGEVLWDDGFARVVLVGDADHPGFCRVILNAHKKEMTALEASKKHDLAPSLIYKWIE